MQTTTAIRIPLLRSISRRQQIAAGCSYREAPTLTVYRHLLHEVNGLAVNFAELPVAAQILSSFQLQNYWFSTGEMQI